MKPIGELIAQLANEFSDHPVVVEVILKGQWKTLLGDRIGSNSVPVSFQDGVLQVTASDERWKKELARISEDIRSRLNGFLGRETVRRIYFLAKS